MALDILKATLLGLSTVDNYNPCLGELGELIIYFKLILIIYMILEMLYLWLELLDGKIGITFY